MEKFTIANGVAFRYRDSAGKSAEGKRVLLLLHGYLESLDTWEEWASLAEGEFRVIVPDLPGHGISQVNSETHTMEFLAETLSALLTQLEIERCTVVGHSMGGYAAEALAELHPEQLEALVLFHSTPNADTPEKKINREREIELIQAGKQDLIATLSAPQGFAQANRKRLSDRIEEFEEQASMTDPEGIVALLRGLIARKNQHEMLQKLPLPQLFIFGHEDEYIPVEVAERIIEEHPQAEVAWLEESGHMGFIEEPERSLQIIREFVAKL